MTLVAVVETPVRSNVAFVDKVEDVGIGGSVVSPFEVEVDVAAESGFRFFDGEVEGVSVERISHAANFRPTVSVALVAH